MDFYPYYNIKMSLASGTFYVQLVGVFICLYISYKLYLIVLDLDHEWKGGTRIQAALVAHVVNTITVLIAMSGPLGFVIYNGAPWLWRSGEFLSKFLTFFMFKYLS
ncbi:MAG: hypothetical protein QM484_11410 [Woeseiaceae bacterium]